MWMSQRPHRHHDNRPGLRRKPAVRRFKNAPSPPPAPDPTTVANAQGASNTNTAIAQGILNKTNQVTPYGNLTYTQTGTGSAGYGQAIDNFNRAKNDAYTSALNTATVSGAQQGGADYSRALAGRQQGIQEQSFLREQPLNEAIALMGGGQIQNPNFVQTPQTAVAPTDVLGAYGLNQAAQNTGYQGGVQQASSGNSALAGLGGSLGSAALLGLI